MPVYNSEKFVAEAIESILNQTHQNLELIIIDDASVDKSWEVIQEYIKKDERVKAFRNEENMNIPKTRNRLLKKVSAESKYIAMLDSDDVAMSERLERQVDFLENNTDYSAIGGQIELIDDSGNKIGVKRYPTSYEKIRKTILHFNPFAQSAMMLCKSVVESVGFYNENQSRSQDYDYWCRMFLREFKMTNLSDTLIQFRLHEGQGKQTQSQKSFWYSFLVRKRYIFTKQFFSIKGLMIMIAYFGAALMPASLMVFLYRYVFAK